MPKFLDHTDDAPAPNVRLRKPPGPPPVDKEPAVIGEASPARSLTTLKPGEFRVEISNPQILRTEGALVGRMLRFTLTWALRHPELGLLGCAHDGCLFMRGGATSAYRWALPLARRGKAIIHNYMIFPDFYRYILKFLIERFGTQVGPEDARWK